MTDFEPAVVETTVPPPPGPGGRVQRTAGQVGSAVVLLDLLLAFGWFGSDEWSGEQVSAVTAAVVFVIAGLHNLYEHFSARPAAAVVVDVEG